LTLPPLSFVSPLPSIHPERDIRAVKFNFRKLGVLEHAESNSAVGVCGVVKLCRDYKKIMSTGSALFKRDLALADDSVRGK
jgi:hypothetical protein